MIDGFYSAHLSYSCILATNPGYQSLHYSYQWGVLGSRISDRHQPHLIMYIKLLSRVLQDKTYDKEDILLNTTNQSTEISSIQ